ncbi:MAG: UDP-2,3-diacylglucosamine diphosphatase [Bacteroidales bacterium]|nr:UDP-2,3-diacylglucosamine diphosphatase [Bacteroidales bacterium]
MNFLLTPDKKAYFASDLHLRMAPDADSRQREITFVRWLDAIRNDAAVLFLLGDMFDYWFEYRHVIPRGFVRLLGKLQELSETGVEIHYFTGNHDMWMNDYFPVELGIAVHRHPEECTINGKVFLLGHGHNLGPVSWGERLMNAVFTSQTLKVPFIAIHPRWTMAFGIGWSKRNRKKHGWAVKFTDIRKEYLACYALECLRRKHYDYFIFGHRHLALDVRLAENSRYINTGEWITGNTYASFDGENLQLAAFQKNTEWLTVNANPSA